MSHLAKDSVLNADLVFLIVRVFQGFRLVNIDHVAFPWLTTQALEQMGKRSVIERAQLRSSVELEGISPGRRAKASLHRLIHLDNNRLKRQSKAFFEILERLVQLRRQDRRLKRYLWRDDSSTFKLAPWQKESRALIVAFEECWGPLPNKPPKLNLTFLINAIATFDVVSDYYRAHKIDFPDKPLQRGFNLARKFILDVLTGQDKRDKTQIETHARTIDHQLMLSDVVKALVKLAPTIQHFLFIMSPAQDRRRRAILHPPRII